ncbi:hypothetical protein TeGR_g5580 [Tetraparma gracilis]|uniref:Uncharacterized protein n=1 Tax=Tetraparma gracilis TaxID=2962635 RepID=A0ABQ6N753_9STRA|nr:hypothetical protein TeGR_g5580 [Tetraparma gracilis]
MEELAKVDTWTCALNTHDGQRCACDAPEQNVEEARDGRIKGMQDSFEEKRRAAAAKKEKALADAPAAAAKKEEKERAAAAKKEKALADAAAAAAKKEEKVRAAADKERAKEEKGRAAAAEKEAKKEAEEKMASLPKEEKKLAKKAKALADAAAAAAKKEKALADAAAAAAKNKAERVEKERELATRERDSAAALAEKEKEKMSDAEKAVSGPLREILARCKKRRDDLVPRFQAFFDKNRQTVDDFLNARGASVAGEHEENGIASDARQLEKVLKVEREFKVEVEKALAKPLLVDAKTPSPQVRKVLAKEKGRVDQMEDDERLGLSAAAAASRLRNFPACQDAAAFQSEKVIDKLLEMSRLNDLFHGNILDPELSQLPKEELTRLIRLHADFFGDMLTANENRILNGVDFTADFLVKFKEKFGDKWPKVMESLRRAKRLDVPIGGTLLHTLVIYPSNSCLCAFCTGAAGVSFCHLGDLVNRRYDRTIWVDGRGRVFSQGKYDADEFKEIAATYDGEGYANVAVTFSSNFVPLPYRSSMKLATLQWAGVMGPSFILSETCDHLVANKTKNGIADTQPVDKAENVKRSVATRKRGREKAAEGEDGGGGGGE